MNRPIYEIAKDIRKAWPNVHYAARPYLNAMGTISGPSDLYGIDDAKSIVIYFLGNARTFKGPEAKALKAELKKVCGIK